MVTHSLETARQMKFFPRVPEFVLIPWIWGLVLAMLLTGRMVFADFCIIDDHWQALWLGSTGGFSFSKIWPTAVATELGSLGSVDGIVQFGLCISDFLLRAFPWLCSAWKVTPVEG